MIGIVGRRREQDVPRIARRADEARHVAQETLREIGEAQLLEILHLAANDALVHRFVERNERLLEELAQALSYEELRQMILQLAHAMLREKLDRGLDLRGQRRRLVHCEAEHRLQRRVGERHDRACTPAFGQELLDELEACDLIGRIHPVSECVAQRHRKAVSALPHVELLAAQAGDADHFTDVQRAPRVAGAFLNVHGCERRLAAAGRCLDENAHASIPVRTLLGSAEAVTHKYSLRGRPSHPPRAPV